MKEEVTKEAMTQTITELFAILDTVPHVPISNPSQTDLMGYIAVIDPLIRSCCSLGMSCRFVVFHSPSVNVLQHHPTQQPRVRNRAEIGRAQRVGPSHVFEFLVDVHASRLCVFPPF